MPNFRSIGPFKQKLLRGGGRICPPPAIPICKTPGLFRVKQGSITITPQAEPLIFTSPVFFIYFPVSHFPKHQGLTEKEV